VLQFLVDHVERTTEDGTLIHDLPPAIDHTLVENGFKGELGAPALNTVLHRLSVLSKAHQMRDVTNPTRDPAVQELVRRIRRAYAARGVRHKDADKPLIEPAAEALTAWLTASGVHSGPLFQRVRKTKAVEPLSGQAVGPVVKRARSSRDWRGISGRIRCDRDL
jgi:hypothetical protein